MHALIRFFASVLALALFSSPVLAAWKLDAEQSTLHFVSIKNNAVAEVHSFGGLTGEVTDEGVATLAIALDSVETNIPIRNERMRKLLFDTTTFAQATAALSVEPKVLSGLKKGAEILISQDLQLSLRGVTGTLPTVLRVTRLDKKTWRVATAQPVIVNASSFDLATGIESLREVAKLAAIGLSVPVTVSLTFRSE